MVCMIEKLLVNIGIVSGKWEDWSFEEFNCSTEYWSLGDFNVWVVSIIWKLLKNIGVLVKQIIREWKGWRIEVLGDKTVGGLECLNGAYYWKVSNEYWRSARLESERIESVKDLNVV